MLFFTTARLTQFSATLFQEDAVKRVLGGALPVWEIHSRKSQNARTRAADEFRHAPSGLLFSSDVSARGTCRWAGVFVWRRGLGDCGGFSWIFFFGFSICMLSCCEYHRLFLISIFLFFVAILKFRFQHLCSSFVFLFGRQPTNHSYSPTFKPLTPPLSTPIYRR
jgi:hypothetical protein